MEPFLRLIFICVFLLAACAGPRHAPLEPSHARWSMGPSRDPSYFPIGVWLQEPELAAKYRELGINLYVGLWNGPSEKQLSALREAGMQVICHQNQVALRYLQDSLIVGWLQEDEPDNAQPLSDGNGFGPPIHPGKVISDYRKIHSQDPSRPVLLNLGQGVAWDNWKGRGPRTNHPEDYPEYMKGGDIISFDIYPASHTHEEVAGNIWYVAKGVDRLNQWKAPGQLVWNFLECTRVKNSKRKISPKELRAAAWMSIIHGSRGLIYFAHEFEPEFKAAALLDDPEMQESVRALNREIAELAAVINSPDIPKGLSVSSDNAEMPIATMMKSYGGATYVFASALGADTASVEFSLKAYPNKAKVTVLGERRSLALTDEKFGDTFHPWDVHIYRIEN